MYIRIVFSTTKKKEKNEKFDYIYTIIRKSKRNKKKGTEKC